MIDITNISYPCYVSPIYTNRIIYIPSNDGLGLKNIAGQSIPNPFLKLQTIKNFVLEGYAVDKHLKFIDCIPLQDFNAKKCQLIYEDRLRLLRGILNDTLADYSKYKEVPNYVAYYPNDIKQLYSQLLTEGCKGVTIMDVDGFYTFGATEKYKIELISGRK